MANFAAVVCRELRVYTMSEKQELEFAGGTDVVRLYRVGGRQSALDVFLATSADTRSICNDPTVAGVDYTRKLQGSCREILKALPLGLIETETVVVNILRGGLNFGLREALADAYGWNAHTTCFISAQRARDDSDPEAWHITENDYKKLYFPSVASFVIGDVVATGTSLHYGLLELIESAQSEKVDLRSVVFFTYGGAKAEEILERLDAKCRQVFPHYEKTTLIYLEGRFTVAENDTPLSVRLTGTDLLRYQAWVTPEFLESQYEDPAYPIERCIIYDAGSRAFWLYEYVADVIGYWKQNLEFAEQGMTYQKLLKERFPEIDATRFGDVSLKKLALRQLERMEHVIERKTK